MGMPPEVQRVQMASEDTKVYSQSEQDVAGQESVHVGFSVEGTGVRGGLGGPGGRGGARDGGSGGSDGSVGGGVGGEGGEKLRSASGLAPGVAGAGGLGEGGGGGMGLGGAGGEGEADCGGEVDVEGGGEVPHSQQPGGSQVIDNLPSLSLSMLVEQPAGM